MEINQKHHFCCSGDSDYVLLDPKILCNICFVMRQMSPCQGIYPLENNFSIMIQIISFIVLLLLFSLIILFCCYTFKSATDNLEFFSKIESNVEIESTGIPTGVKTGPFSLITILLIYGVT